MIHHYETFRWKPFSQGLEIIVSTPCLGSDSLGNVLGGYFEALVCAQLAGLHYVVVAKIWEPSTKDKPTLFLDRLPSVVEHTSPAKHHKTGLSLLREHCKCPGSCHERPNAAWVKGVDTIRSLLRSALQYHIFNSPGPKYLNTIVSASDKASVPVGTILPFIPDAAIHYRCGDNFIGHYGFVPFVAFTSQIPVTVSTIYVLAEDRARKTTSKPHLAAKCDAVFEALFMFLRSAFPQAKVLIRRGDDLYADFARLSYAPVTVCSVSTFCLWPALISNGTAYFPKTKLILGARTDIDVGFRWFDTPAVVLGAAHEYASSDALVRQLKAPAVGGAAGPRVAGLGQPPHGEALGRKHRTNNPSMRLRNKQQEAS